MARREAPADLTPAWGGGDWPRRRAAKNSDQWQLTSKVRGRRPTTAARRRPTGKEDLGFVRRPMVRWLDPHQLVDTSARVLASGLVTSYTDSRELQALVAADVYDRSDREEVWFDYVSDLGDGWNSTYTVARLLAQDKLELTVPVPIRPLHSTTATASPIRTERGSILVMGGDQVYPVPTRTQYENRFLGPYRAARARVGRRARRAPTCSSSRAATTGTTGSSTSPTSSAASGRSAGGGPTRPGATSPCASPTAGGCGGSTSSSATTSTRPRWPTSPAPPSATCSPATASSSAWPRRSRAGARAPRCARTGAWATSSGRWCSRRGATSCSTSRAVGTTTPATRRSTAPAS